MFINEDTINQTNIAADFEDLILGGLLVDPNALDRIVEILPTEAFVNEQNRHLYNAIKSTQKKYGRYDLNLIVAFCQEKKKLDKIGGKTKLHNLCLRTVSAVNIDYYAKNLIANWQRRKANLLGAEIQNLAADFPGDPTLLLKAIEERVLSFTQSEYRDPEEDKDWVVYSKLIEKIKEVERTKDPGFRHYKKMLLADSYKRPVKQLEEIYLKHLTNAECEPSLDFSELLEKYGQNFDQWLLHGLLPAGSVILLHALGGIGKTRLAYDIVYRLSSGEGYNDFNHTAQSRKSMIVQCDETPNDMLRRLEDRGFNEALPVRFKTRWLADHFDDLIREVEEHRPEFILIDSLTAIQAKSIVTENETEYARPVLRLRDLAQEYGATILLVHHSNDRGGSRGTKAIYNSVSEVWKLEGSNETDSEGKVKRFLEIEKSRSRQPENLTLSFDPDNNEWQIIGQQIESEGESATVSYLSYTESLIVQLLAEHKGIGFEIQELTEILDQSFEWIRKCCSKLARQGLISRRKSLADTKKGRKNFVYYVQWQTTDDDPNCKQLRYFRHSCNNQGENFKAGNSNRPQEESFQTPKIEMLQENGQFPALKNQAVENCQDANLDSNPENVNLKPALKDCKNSKNDGNESPSKNENFKAGNAGNSLTIHQSPSDTGLEATETLKPEIETLKPEIESLKPEIENGTPKMRNNNKVWGTEGNLNPLELQTLITRYLQVNGESSEFEIALNIDQGLSEVRNALAKVAVKTQSINQGVYQEQYWDLP